MEVSDSFRDRMKSYEKKYGFIFSEDLPIICRVDGRSFSNWTRSLDRPVDVDFANVMRNVAVSVMKEIQGCVLSYTESDEITFVLVKSCEVSDLFFGGNQQKLNSMIASMTTAYFNNYIAELREKNIEKWTKPLAFFDCRSFSIPKDDAPNNIIWRIHDAKRNSILGAARTFHSHKEVANKNTSEILSSFEDAKLCWENLSDEYKFGAIFYKDENMNNDIVKEAIKNPSDYEKGELYSYIYKVIFKENIAESMEAK